MVLVEGLNRFPGFEERVLNDILGLISVSKEFESKPIHPRSVLFIQFAKRLFVPGFQPESKFFIE